MKNSKKIIFTLLFFVVFISLTLIFHFRTEQNRVEENLKYFSNFNLTLKGVICNVEKQTGSLKYIISLKEVESNNPNFNDGGSDFCIVNNKNAVFVDHTRDYQIGDTIYLGENKNDLIKCISSNGVLKFVKKRDEMIRYNIDRPNKRMKQLLELGCRK